MGKRKEAEWVGDDYDDLDDDSILKKKPKTADDLLIQQVLKEDDSKKKAKQEAREGGPVRPKGKTLAEIEAEEGGPVKESLVGMAHVKRAANRKKDEKVEAEDTEVPAEVDKYEEEAEVEEEDGVKFTGFNLKEERETGYFDDEGNYVERKDKSEDVKDAWMASDESKVVSAEVRQLIEERQRKAAEAAAARQQGPLTDRQIAALKRELASHMQRGETLAKLLKRLGGGSAPAKAMGKRERARLQAAAAEAAPGAAAGTTAATGPAAAGADGEGTAAAATFARVTEIADQLVEEGEMDVYDGTREDFESFAAMWLPKQPAAGASGSAAGGAAGGAGSSKAAAKDDEDDDMFGDAFEEKDDKKGVAADAAGAAAAAAGQDAATGKQPSQESEFASWPVKELKRYLQEQGVDPSSFVEKSDMVAKCDELSKKGPAVAEGTKAHGQYNPPPGYVFDPSSGYFHNAEAGYYFDTHSGGYFRQGKWFSLDPATGRFSEWK